MKHEDIEKELKEYFKNLRQFSCTPPEPITIGLSEDVIKTLADYEKRIDFLEKEYNAMWQEMLSRIQNLEILCASHFDKEVGERSRCYDLLKMIQELEILFKSFHGEYFANLPIIIDRIQRLEKIFVYDPGVNITKNDSNKELFDRKEPEYRAVLTGMDGERKREDHLERTNAIEKALNELYPCWKSKITGEPGELLTYLEDGTPVWKKPEVEDES